MFTYHDPRYGRTRFKRRYVWGFWGLTAGIAIGYSLALA